MKNSTTISIDLAKTVFQVALFNKYGVLKSNDNWLTLTKDFRRLFHGAVGHSDVLTDYCEHKGLKRRTNVNCCDKLLA
ncbi:hypothetical protein [Colwellia sp. 20A7]|uniref:hypothetical protein n=1 Tax=Colwellia sp. 20A7 TaxID=2689569 RepID=UPI001357B6DB|nr:hypothetical protein [Colwellia sp. 20A7]